MASALKKVNTLKKRKKIAVVGRIIFSDMEFLDP